MSTDDPEIYPMPLFPQLTVSDTAASTEWYRAIGFDVIYSMPVMVHLRYRKYADVMLVADRTNRDEEVSPDSRRGQGVSIYLTVEDESVDDVAHRAAEYGAEIASEPHETAWNTREVALRDPDGYELVFSERAESDRTFEEVMGSADRT